MLADTVGGVAARSLRRTLAGFRAGSRDPTTRIDATGFLHATHTPDGPGTLRLRWARDPSPPDESGLEIEGWGPGASWLAARVPALTGELDPPFDVRRDLPHAAPAVVRALRLTAGTRIAASGNLYHLLLPTVIAQRITAGEALRQWARLCTALGEPAPGPTAVTAGLRLPPRPETLRRRPAWWFHPLGIESKRARTLVEVARHADRLWEWADAGSATAARKLALIPGVGPWTIGSVLGPGLGDPDAVPVGDFHLPSIVAWNLAGEPRADDARMLALLEPFQGQRGRVLHAIVAAGVPAPKFGPRRPILPIRHL